MVSECTAIIPAYNAEKYIINAIESLLNQTIELKKIIIIDDCSTDNTLNKIQENYSSLIKSGIIDVYFSDKNKGVSFSRNLGVDYAKTEWVVFLDADDLLTPKTVELLLDKAFELNVHASRPYDLVHAAYQLIDSNGTLKNAIFSWRQVDFSETLGWLFYRNQISTSGLLVKRQRYLELGGFDPSLSHNEDWDLWLRFAHNSGIGYVDKALTYVRRHQNNASRSMEIMHKAESKILRRYPLEKIKLEIMKRSCSFSKNICDFVSILFRLDEFEQGYNEIKQAIRINISDDYLFFEALYWIKKEHFDKAEVLFRKCVDSNTENAAAQNNLGATLLLLSNEVDAKKHIAKALTLQPNYIDALHNLKIIGIENISKADVRFTWRELRPILTDYEK